MPRLSTDNGRTADRVASIEPLELHQAICTAAIAAVRAGAPLERLDGLEYFHLRSAGFGIRNVAQQRRELLEARISRQQVVAEQARANANAATSERTRSDFLLDVENAYIELEQLERQLEQASHSERPGVTPDQFDAEIDFIAHALAQLANTRTTPTGEFGEAVKQVITDVRIVPDPLRRLCDVEFSLLLPADGMVLRFGPIRTTVANRAYPAKLPDDMRPDAPRLVLTRQATVHQIRATRATSDHEVLQEVKRALVAHGYTDLAAGTIVRSDFGPLYEITANDLWGEPLTGDYDPQYVELVRRLYRSADFSWNPRRHSLDCTMRQQLVDVVAARGGHATYPDVISDLANTGIDDQRITVYSRAQQLGDAPPWEPCVERLGTWAQYAKRTARSLRLWGCPHCGGHATKVLRVPEVAACLLCPDCRRMPSADSPVFPEEYLLV
jgi:hypothetical protein